MLYITHEIIEIINTAGYQDIFLKMTCNTQWKEIENALLRGQ